MKKKNVLIATTTALIFLAFAYQSVEAARAADASKGFAPVPPAQDEAAVSSFDYRPSVAAAPNVGSEVGDMSQAPSEIATSDALSQLPQTQSAPIVTLRAESGATILFKTQNGRTIKNNPPQMTNPPHLVLYRNGMLTESAERTLIVTVGGLRVPRSGLTVTLEVRTQHGDPEIGPGYEKNISVWRETLRLQNFQGTRHESGEAVFAHEFADRTVSATETIATPTDYFQCDVTVTDADHPATDPLYVFHQDYAFLMENQWKVRLPEVKEVAEGAAPAELLLFYCDMFPFRKSLHDLSTWLPREEITKYVDREVIPAMVEAFRVQSDDWDFPWYPAWTNPRPGGDPDQLTIALTDGQAWFHGVAPSLANSHMSIRVNAAEYGDYGTLKEGIMSAFHHELFHNLQRNISQEFGGKGNLKGAEDRWLFFTEGTAMLASSVGQEAVQFDVSPGERAFVSRANEFLGQGKDVGELNTSYAELLPYRAALYWRFLYEQCGGMRDGIEGRAAGMRVIRQTLITLFSGKVIDIAASNDLVEGMPQIMNAVFAQDDVTCPFNNYEQSLLQFARAVYALRVDGGRCLRPGLSAGCWFYDPNNLYVIPPVSTITYSGEAINYGGDEGTAGIGSSFGLDFIEVILDPAADGKPFRLQFYAAPDTVTEFKVELWKLSGSGGDSSLQPALRQEAMPQILVGENSNGPVTYYIPVVDRAAYDRLALIISRLDAGEDQDSVGEYTITLSMS